MNSEAVVADHIEQANRALQQRNFNAALGVLAEADRRFPGEIQVKLTTALAHRLRGDNAGALAAFDAALVIDPYSFLALLSKGAVLDRMGDPRAAAAIYRNALDAAPPADRIAPVLAAPVARAREVIAADTDALEAFIRDQIAAIQDRPDGAAARRFEQGLDVFLGRKTVYEARPMLLHYPELPAIQFLDRAQFPWLAELEAATDTIRDELTALMRTKMDDFAPYIAYPPGSPINQWKELNHSRKWSSFWLWRGGERMASACALCPRTAALLESLPMADQTGFAPTAVFSALEPHTHIPPHTGSTNARLLVHLPLILPGPARFRVGNETREWKMGEAWVFDDTIEHEAWNDADELRVILIFDIWNPALTAGERALISAMMLAKNAFYAR